MDTKIHSDSLAKSDSEKALKEMYDFYLELDKTMAKAFEIDLNNYRKIDTLVGFMQPEYRELNIWDVRQQIALKYGDTVPSIYLTEGNTNGVALTQNLQGLYNLYEFEINKDKESRYKWKITGTKTVRGERRFVKRA